MRDVFTYAIRDRGMAAKSFAHLRHSTGLSQTAFAELIGFSVHSIQSIEQGRVDVSENVARAAFRATGAIPVFLTMPDSISLTAQAWTREPYSPDHFKAWQGLLAGDILRTLGGNDDQRFPAVIAAFMDAAKESGRLGAMQAAVAMFINELAFELDFAADARALAHKRGHGAAFDFLASVAGRINP